MKKIFLSILVSLCICCTSLGYAKNYYDRAEVKTFIKRMVKQHNFDRAYLKALFKNATVQTNVLDAIRAPAERKKKWFEYRPIFLNDARIQGGIEYWQEHRQTLQEVEQQYGVPAEIIVAIIGVETYYGRLTGKHPVFDSLVTLGFDYPKRSKFFLSELEHYLLLCREEGFDPAALKGSYAGAMGRGQFISSSYRRYAIDYNQDGKRDLWDSNEDAIGSVANYFYEHGWKPNHVVTSSAQFNGDIMRVDRSNALKPSFTYRELNTQGFVADMPVGMQEKLSLFVLDGKEGNEYWLGHHNFYVITRYNHSEMYAMAVFQLSQEIKQHLVLNGLSENE